MTSNELWDHTSFYEKKCVFIMLAHSYKGLKDLILKKKMSKKNLNPKHEKIPLRSFCNWQNICVFLMSAFIESHLINKLNFFYCDNRWIKHFSLILDLECQITLKRSFLNVKLRMRSMNPKPRVSSSHRTSYHLFSPYIFQVQLQHNIYSVRIVIFKLLTNQRNI